MALETVLAHIDAEIARLKQARALLADTTDALKEVPTGKKRGRPAGTPNKTAPAKGGKRTMSEEGKARIAAAQKARWAAQKEQSS